MSDRKRPEPARGKGGCPGSVPESAPESGALPQWTGKGPGGEPAILAQMIRRARPIRAGRPVELREFDRKREAIVLAYDPGRTPAPQFALLDGFRPGEKVLTMNGAQLLRIHDAGGVTLADVNLVEADIGA